MPIYAFACDTCDHTFDRLQKLSDPDPEICPRCENKTIRRQLTAPAFRLAGSGWYETDFKKDGDKKRNLVDSSSGENKSSDTKPTESTPAAASTKSETVSPSSTSSSDAKPAATKPAAN